MKDPSPTGPLFSRRGFERAEGRWSTREGKDPAPHPRPCVACCHRGSGRRGTVVGHTQDADRSAPGAAAGAVRGRPALGPRGPSRLAAVRRRAGEPVRLYVTVVTLAGVLLTAWLIVAGRFHPDAFVAGTLWPGDARRLMFAAVVLIGELFSLTVPRRDAHAAVTTSPTLAFGLLLGWGVGWALVALVGSAVIADVVRRKPLRKVFFNAGQYALAIGVSGLVYQ